MLLLDVEMSKSFPEPSPEQVDRVARLIDELLDDASSRAKIEEYYHPDGNFAGHTFLDLAPNQPYAIGVEDLLAVTTLAVNPGAPAARALLPGGNLVHRVSALLARIPLGVAIWEATDRHLCQSHLLWSLLVGHAPNVGATTAGKILARKRPELIPIVDSVIKQKLQCAPNSYWMTFRLVLKDSERRSRISDLAPELPILRTLDTLMWMHWRQASPE
jgi:hypothetical protein